MSKRSSIKSKRRRKALPALGFAGVSFSLASGACALTSEATANTPSTSQSQSHELLLGEEEIFDVSLATFYIYDKENAGPSGLPQNLRLARGCGGCGGGCRCGGGGGGCRCGGGGGGCRCGGGIHIGCGGGCHVACRSCRCGGFFFRGCLGCGGCTGCGGCSGSCWIWTPTWGWVYSCSAGGYGPGLKVRLISWTSTVPAPDIMDRRL
jgi:hypothetical protein